MNRKGGEFENPGLLYHLPLFALGVVSAGFLRDAISVLLEQTAEVAFLVRLQTLATSLCANLLLGFIGVFFVGLFLWWLTLRLASRPRVARVLPAIVIAAATMLCAWPLFDGAQIRSRWYGPLAPYALIVPVIGASILASHLARRAIDRSPALRTAFFLAAVAAFLVDSVWLRGLYPTWHLWLIGSGLLGCGVFCAGLGFSRRAAATIGVVLVVCGLLCGLLLRREILPGTHPAVRALTFATPVTGRWLPAGHGDADDAVNETARDRARKLLAPPAACDAKKLDARFEDRRRFNVLLITIDTLRADRLGRLRAGSHSPRTSIASRRRRCGFRTPTRPRPRAPSPWPDF